MKNQRTFIILSLILLSIFHLIRSQVTPCQPTQIHLSFGDAYYSVSQGNSNSLATYDNQAYLVWHSQDACDYNIFVSDAKTLQNVTEASVSFWNDFSYDFTLNADPKNTGLYQTKVYTALLKGLEYGKLYQYVIFETASGTSSGPFKFRMSSPYMQQNPLKLIVAADIDIFENGIQTIQALSKLATENYDDYSGWLILGDIAYNLQDENGLRGDNFFNTIQPFVSEWPIVMALGNHDRYANWSFVNTRIRNPLYNITENHYFSFNLQGIHFTFVNLDQFEKTTPDIQAEILEWIENDLNVANSAENRQKWPWLVFIVHRPIYCSYVEQDAIIAAEKWCYSLYEKRQVWDELMHKYSVDLTLMADKHSYERMGPMYQNKTAEFTKMDNDPTHHNIIDPAATVFIMDGTAGQNYYTPKPYLPSGYTWVADVRPGYSVLYTEDNANDRRLVFEHYISATGEKLDFMNLIKTKPQPVPEASGGSWITIILAICVIVVIFGLGYWYWKKRQDQQEKQREGFYQDIPLLDLHAKR